MTIKFFQANSKIAGVVAIARTLQAKVDVGEASETEAENLAWELKNLTTEAARENAAHKEIVDDLQAKQDRVDAVVREMREEIRKLKETLAARPTSDEVLANL